MERADRYIMAVYENKSFSKAAKEMYISQPSLSATIKKRETELGILIFDREKTPVELTREGKIYMEYLDEALKNETDMKSRLKTLSSSPKKRLVVQGKNYLAGILIPRVFAVLRRHYYDVEMIMDLGSGINDLGLFDRLESGKADLMISYSSDKAGFSYLPLYEESFVVAVRRDALKNDALLTHAVTYNEITSDCVPESKVIEDYTIFRKEEFLRTGRISSDQGYILKFVEEAAHSFAHIYNTETHRWQYEMMLCGLGAIVTNDIMIRAMGDHSDVLYFAIEDDANIGEAKIMFRNDSNLSDVAKDFVNIATELCRDKNKLFLY